MREHEWVEETAKPHPYWRNRHCTICHLRDIKLRQPGPGDLVCRVDWGVTTPCIEPVPDTVSFDALVAELKAHHVTETPHAVGHPGKWCIGFQVGDSYPTPLLEASTLEEGWAELLRWTRARQYAVSRNDDILRAKRSSELRDCCYDDD